MTTTFTLTFADDVNPADIHDIVFDTITIVQKYRQVQIVDAERPNHLPAGITIETRR